MTDKELQNLMDRLAQGDQTAAFDDVEDSADLRAYQLLYEALGEEPAGSLSNNFAQKVANRAMSSPATAPVLEKYPWIEWLLPPLILVTAFIVTLFALPRVLTLSADVLQAILLPIEQIWTILRLDIVLPMGGTLLFITLLDRLIRRMHVRKTAVHP